MLGLDQDSAVAESKNGQRAMLASCFDSSTQPSRLALQHDKEPKKIIGLNESILVQIRAPAEAACGNYEVFPPGGPGFSPLLRTFPSAQEVATQP